ncbi:uroporphyrinogen decarboxylase family protein [Acidobacteriota bacterium]
MLKISGSVRSGISDPVEKHGCLSTRSSSNKRGQDLHLGTLQLNGKKRVLDALTGIIHSTEAFPTGPLVTHYCAQLAGITMQEYTCNPEAMAQSVIAYYNKFLPDAVWISADTWVLAEAMGANVFFPDIDQPMCGTGLPLFEKPSDINRIPPPDVSQQGRLQRMIESLKRVKDGIGEEVFIVGCFDQSPFSLACQLMGIENIMQSLVLDPEPLKKLMDRCTEYCVVYGTALAEGGADMLSTGDSPAGLIGRQKYREIALPYEQKVFRTLKEKTDLPLSLHICGNCTHILEDMAESGADILEIDHLVGLDQACQKVPPEITLWGNIDPVSVLELGDPETVLNTIRQTVETIRGHGRNRFVLSSGCTVTPCTPQENLAILCSYND